MNAGIIRPATVADLDAVMAIENAWPTTPRWTRAHFEHEIASERSYFCVCALGNVVRGQLSPKDVFGGGKKKEVEGYAGLLLVPPEAQVTTVAVCPGCARQGLGRRLMGHLHQTAAQAGCTAVSLEVSEANRAALRLYEALGYRIVGRRPKYYNDGSDALLMICRLK